MSERKMVHVEVVHRLEAIENADAIELAHVLGWQVVVKKGEFKEEQKVAFFEIDSWVPEEVAPFLVKGATAKEYNGVPGAKLRTIKLRGVLSQGLVLALPEEAKDIEEGTDITSMFNVQKWEMSDVQLSGSQRGSFPSQLVKTDQDRIQNVFNNIKRKVKRGELIDEWNVQEKLEGSSMQVAIIDDDVHVLSRNCDLKLDDEANTFVKVAKENRLTELVEIFQKTIGHGYFSLLGELIGPSIQGNIYNLSKPEFRLFDVYTETGFKDRAFITKVYNVAKHYGYDLKMVPIQKEVIKGLFNDDVIIEDILKMAEIKSALNESQDAEGIVVKNVHDPSVTFKVISNKYLLKCK